MPGVEESKRRRVEESERRPEPSMRKYGAHERRGDVVRDRRTGSMMGWVRQRDVTAARQRALMTALRRTGCQPVPLPDAERVGFPTSQPARSRGTKEVTWANG